MAVFETNPTIKILDDTVPLTCTIESAVNVGSHTEYIVRVQRGPLPENNWTIRKRYSDFVTLDTELHISNVSLVMPPKKVFGNMGREFVAERQSGLQQYLNILMNNHLLASCLIVKKFLDPENYSANLSETALQHVSMICRSEPKWEVVEPLHNFGWRLRKHYILVKPIENLKARQILSWSDYGPCKFLPSKELLAVIKLLSSVQHPFIAPIEFSIANENGGMVIRKFYEEVCSPLKLQEIQRYGRQILEVLKFLYDKGLPYGQLHTGNIVLTGETCQLLDLENWLLGLPSYYKPFFTQFKKIQKMELIDVFSFGHVLYEMTFGEQLAKATCDSFPASCPAELRSVLESILTTEACKNGLPTLSDLLSHTFFSSYTLQLLEKPILKIPSKLKEAIRLAKDSMEIQLKEEQKMIHQLKRFTKAKEFHMSEGEKMRRRKTKKKEKALENVKDDSSASPSSISNTNSSAPASPADNGILSPPSSAGLKSTFFSGSVSPPTAVESTIESLTPLPASGDTRNSSPPSSGRSALLGSICNFNKTALKKSKTNDRSAPNL
ncbi:PXK [Acanthosepion pharaonis]|uniref:PXK n=1 Tax=Acanthosepion pharaonis TaxID=158019 RepID=A0A812EUH1_ACAPH|nr:PXK [Sepia pharaonis]